MSPLSVSRPGRIRAAIDVPPDKSISHRAFIFNAIADGRATIEHPLDSQDVRSTATCLAALGVGIDWPAGRATATVTGRGMHGLFESEDVLDCGNSGTTMRLLTGLLSAHPLLSVLTGDASLKARPMARVISPLRKMGAHIHARRGDTLAPIVIKGGDLAGIAYDSPVASAQVKSALLLAGLYADGDTSVSEPGRSRDHSERMLSAMGAPLVVEGATARVSPTSRLEPLSLRVPGDISSAAPWLVLAVCHSDAEILVRGVNTNSTRTGLLDILRAMGADFELLEERAAGGEPVADLLVRSSRLNGTVVSGELVPRAIDELPLVALLGCFAEGETMVRDAAELRAKESDRIEALVHILGRMGARVTARPDGFTIHGPVPGLRGARVDAIGDHRMGMLAAIAGTLAEGETRIDNDAVGVSYPSFFQDLARACDGAAALP
ncbi:MAG: 3-phosphoshikimate 1-carboxyvinyltransferase [Dehalococcoidia bacterium]|nr:3-phosphoshikimate 1-carboxyvinyltransferase [Dehalococcoidia bacterium]RIL02146.1 MAG: 3-phosphoshikimate 1-carboxyvinyltransferase [bacterium]